MPSYQAKPYVAPLDDCLIIIQVISKTNKNLREQKL